MLGSSNSSSSSNGGILPASAQADSTSNAIVPYQASQIRSYGGDNGYSNGGGYNNGGGNFNSGGNYNGGYNNVTSLKTESAHIRNEFKDLRDEVVYIRNEGKRGSVALTEKSPLGEPLRGRAKTSEAMYTPKDLEVLHKAYKDALVQKDLALHEAEVLKERMARMGASKYRQSIQKYVLRKTTPRSLKTAMNAVEIESNGEKDEQEDGEAKEKGRITVDVAHDPEEEMLKKFRENRMKEIHAGKKADLEKLYVEEEISYIKLDQAKTDIVEIPARRDYDEWLKTKKTHDDDDQHHDYATSAEDMNDE
ncbi:hypothetical protein CBR_g45504 [Chara braunii]|uniref:Uncharacterized protein n=1 Tax=Chara braunii TaxID=69332 RepID=A0A388LYS1_CHABU|nr:hypothetical protein CBR_g45504 [Chara braunii]|eukprot:GBG87446.1 hypothetical protein CBR_g45504 [Chara braunii]